MSRGGGSGDALNGDDVTMIGIGYATVENNRLEFATKVAAFSIWSQAIFSSHGIVHLESFVRLL